MHILLCIVLVYHRLKLLSRGLRDFQLSKEAGIIVNLFNFPGLRLIIVFAVKLVDTNHILIRLNFLRCSDQRHNFVAKCIPKRWKLEIFNSSVRDF